MSDRRCKHVWKWLEVEMTDVFGRLVNYPATDYHILKECPRCHKRERR